MFGGSTQSNLVSFFLFSSQIVECTPHIRNFRAGQQTQGVQTQRIGRLLDAANVRRGGWRGQLQILCAILYQITGVSAYWSVGQSRCGRWIPTTLWIVHIEPDAAIAEPGQSRMPWRPSLPLSAELLGLQCWAKGCAKFVCHRFSRHIRIQISVAFAAVTSLFRFNRATNGECFCTRSTTSLRRC